MGCPDRADRAARPQSQQEGGSPPYPLATVQRSHGTRDGTPTDETRYDVSSLRTSAKGLLQHVRNRWSIENRWHWVRDVLLREDARPYRENNGVQILARLRSLAIHALRLEGIWSITEGIAALAHDIRGLLRLLGWRETAEGEPQG